MMSSAKPTITEIIAKLKSLTENLQHANEGDDRRAWLRQFRSLLNQADQLAQQEAAQADRRADNY
ncbi:MAG TPA: hypothetical protein VF753_20990 [Terriglobales bacterium]